MWYVLGAAGLLVLWLVARRRSVKTRGSWYCAECGKPLPEWVPECHCGCTSRVRNPADCRMNQPGYDE
jgi:hypothetical protein